MRGFTCILIVLLTVYLGGCDNGGPPEPEPRRADLQIVQLMPFISSVDVFFELYDSKNIIVRDLNRLNSWPPTGYASLLTRATDTIVSDVLIRVVDNDSETEIIPVEPMRLIPDRKTTFCLIDSFGTPKLVRTIDVYNEPPEERILLRFMNLNSQIRSASLRSLNDSIHVEGLNFLNYSSFTVYNSGTYTLEVVDDQTGSVLYTLEDVVLRPQSVYNFFLAQEEETPILKQLRVD